MKAWLFPAATDADLTPRAVALRDGGLGGLCVVIGNGCDCIAVYGAGNYVGDRARHLQAIVDDDGMLREGVPDNAWLTQRIPLLGTQIPLKGAVLVVRHDSAGELVDLTAEDLGLLADIGAAKSAKGGPL